MIKITNLRYIRQNQTILDIKSLHFVHPGLYIILGDSGSGKTTLLHAISGFLHDYSGQIIVGGQSLSTLSDTEHASLLTNVVSVAFQHPVFINDLSAIENVMLASPDTSDENSNYISGSLESLAKETGIAPFLHKKVRVLSGGEKARVNITRALFKNTPIYLFDEPTSALDDGNSNKIMKKIKERSKESIVIVVTHDQAIAKKYGDTIIELAYGKVVKDICNVLAPKPIKEIAKGRAYSLRKSQEIAGKLYKTWRKRNYVATFTANFGLLGIGLGLLLINNLNIKLTSFFAASYSENATFIKTKERQHTDIIKTVEDEDVNYLKRNLRYDIGSYFITNLDDIFETENRVTFYHDAFRHTLPSFHANLFNEVIFFQEVEDETYPYITKLNNDEVILDLPIDDFRVLLTAFNLPYRNNAEDLGIYLQHNVVNIILNVANNNWDYADEQIFRLKAIRLKSKARVIVNDFNFSENLFINKMKLIASKNLTKTEEFPWALKQISFIFSLNSEKILFESTKLPDYIMQRANNNYFRSLQDKFLLKNRLLLFIAPPQFYETFAFLENAFIEADFMFAFSHFPFIEEMLLLGFSHNFLLGGEELLINEAAKEDISDKTNSHVQLNLPPNIVNLSVQNNAFGGFSFYNAKQPLNLHDIIISSALAYKLFGTKDVINKDLYVASLTHVTNQNGLYIKTYEYTSLKIVNVYENTDLALYHHPLWQYLLFKDIFGISPFVLAIEGVFVNDDVQTNESYNLTVTKPFQNYAKLINEALDNIQSYSLFIALTAFVVSFFIVLMIIFHLLNDAFASFNALNLIGYNKTNIENIVFFYVATFFVRLLLFATLQLFVFSFIIEAILSNYFQTKFNYVFIIYPYLYIVALIAFSIGFMTIIFSLMFKHKRSLIFSRRDL